MKERLPWPALSLVGKMRRVGHYLTTGWRRQFLSAFFVLFTISLIVRVIHGNWDLLSNYAWDIRPEWLLYGIAAFFADFFLVIWIWHLLVTRLANYNNRRRTVKIYLQANLSRRIPGMVWYIASRAVLYQEAGVSKTQISLLSGLELAFFMISGFVTTLLTLPFWSGLDEVLSPSAQLWTSLFMLLLGGILVHPRILQKLWQKINRSMPEQELQWGDTAVWLTLYILTWIVGGLVLFSVINFFQPLAITHLITIIGMWSLSGTISLAGFFTISFVGLREVTLIVLLTQLLPMPVTLIVAITVRLMWLTGELLASLVSFRL
ncbi:MAG TPA: hypothetical protein PLD25_10340 [Chloroflexota bacterium]|nr:hypothetical protein [Chloroflexota bacterium]HUM67800.1 hypothetical protein [Chloroflexota bacterium]